MKYVIRISLLLSVIALGVFGVHYSARAQQTHGPQYQEMSDQFFNLLQQDKASDGVDYLFGTNPALNKMQDASANLKTKFTSLRAVAGPYISHTLLAESKVADMFVYQHYFVAYEQQPISVRIRYYKPKTTWVCYGLQFDGELPDEIQKAADAKLSFQIK